MSLLKTLPLTLVLAAAPVRAQSEDSAPQFPPVAEILGETAPLLPTAETADLRDALRAMPPLQSELRALSSGSASRQRGALERLGEARNRRAAPYIGALLLQVNAPVQSRVSAATALGRIGDVDSVPFLERATRDEVKEVRFAAALALGKTKSLDAVAALETTLQNDPHWWVRYAAAVGLGDTRQPAAVPALSRVLNEELRWQVRQQAARALGQIGNQPAVAALGRALTDSDPTVRYSAARALGEIGGSESLDLMHAAYAAEKDPLPSGQLRASLRRASSR
ncbi:MAG: HEAT repeat domain-containing protein [Elusimicrobia bacterium]|nr:HEAT repeat domain-containing protein [Elusimicrobiota bacterium]